MASIRKNLTANARVFRRVGTVNVALFLCAFVGLRAASSNESEQCRQNLQLVFGAIQAYRAAHHRLPDRLEDLIPGQLSGARMLQCPGVPLIQSASGGALNPPVRKSYIYEFETIRLTNDLARGMRATLRDWKQWQMGRVGSGVPIVRCPGHSQYLNLSFGGEIYESGSDWEAHFSAVIDQEELSAENLFAQNVRYEMLRIPARRPGTSPSAIDLTDFYNGSLQGWLPSVPEKNLAEIVPGETRIGGLLFDIRGVIQLRSRHYTTQDRPAAVSNIVVGLRCKELVFLHATVNADAKGVLVCRYMVHFDDGETEEIPITYGREVLDWYTEPSDAIPGNISASWSGSVKGSSRNQAAHLYAVRWKNRKAGVGIRDFDFVSGTSLSSPFLVAVSSDPVESPGVKADPPK